MSTRWGVAGLIAMVLADILLVAWALGLVGGESDTARPQRPAQTTSATSSTSSPTPAPSPESQASTVLLDAASASHALRSAYAPCTTDGPTTAEVERTDDGGATWEATEVQARSVLRVRMMSEQQGFAVVADDDCEPAVLTTADGGATFSGPGPATATWGLWPKTGPEVLVPGGEPAKACATGDATSISAADGQIALVLCGDETVRRTSDAGQTWSDAASVEGATSLSARDDRVVVLVEAEGCEGLAVRAGSVGAQIDLDDGACARDVTAPAAAALVGDGGWLTDGTRTLVTEDLGTWGRSVG